MAFYFILKHNNKHTTYRRVKQLPTLLVLLGKCWSGKLDL